MELNVKNVIAEGLAYTVMGIVVVFAVLVLIMLVIKAMALFSAEKPQVAKEPEQMPKQAPVQVAETITKSDDTELIAVITAAIAAAMGKSASSLMIRSYKKISGNAWNRAGRSETLENRF